MAGTQKYRAGPPLSQLDKIGREIVPWIAMKQRSLWMVFAGGLGLGLLIGMTFRPAWWSTARASLLGTDGLRLTLSAVVDGNDRFVFTQDDAWNDHKDWAPPSDVRFQGQPWTDLSQAPAGWAEVAGDLDLARASILVRIGRGIVTLETTPDGFDVYFIDRVEKEAPYEVVIWIPRLGR